MQAIILAGGLGTRLKSVVSHVPKPMAPINNKPFLDYLMQYLVNQGVTKVVLSLHHQHEIIQNYYENGFNGLHLSSIVETQLLGTGGAIRFSMQMLDLKNPFFVINGDTFVDLDYRQMHEKHLAENATFTMALREVSDSSRYGTAIIDDDYVIQFLEKKKSEPGLINAGVYLFSGNCFSGFNLPPIFSLETDFLFAHIQTIRPCYVLTKGYFIDIGIPDDYKRAIKELPALCGL